MSAATSSLSERMKDFYYDDQIWVVRYLVADTGSWLFPSRWVRVPVPWTWRSRPRRYTGRSHLQAGLQRRIGQQVRMSTCCLTTEHRLPPTRVSMPWVCLRRHRTDMVGGPSHLAILSPM